MRMRESDVTALTIPITATLHCALWHTNATKHMSCLLEHGCQMAIARFLDRMCLALRASGARFTRQIFGLRFGLRIGLRLLFDLMTCLNYSILDFFQYRKSQAKCQANSQAKNLPCESGPRIMAPQCCAAKISSLPFLGLRQGGGRGGAIQGKEGIKFCHLATMSSRRSAFIAHTHKTE